MNEYMCVLCVCLSDRERERMREIVRERREERVRRES